MGSRLIHLFLVSSLVVFLSIAGCGEKAKEEKEVKRTEEVKKAITETLPIEETVEEAKKLAEETGKAVEDVEEEVKEKVESKVEEVKGFVKEVVPETESR
jgi:hypothetical protein